MNNKMLNTEKQYGLIEPKTGKKLTVSDVFNNDSDSGGEDAGNRMRKSAQKEEKGLKKQTKLEMQRALEQDPTVYQYDEVYDEMTQKKQESQQKNSNSEKKSKYINDLLKTAEKRKKENERRLERQIQKEREAEGDLYKDKEEFITSSYKQKLEEFKKAEEEERKMEYIESIMDVSKQQDLGGFYRHLYKETIPNQNPDNTSEIENKKEQSSIEIHCLEVKGEKSVETVKHERNYRKRNHSNSIDGEKTVKYESSSSSSDSDTSSDSSTTSSSNEEEKIEGNDVKLKQNETQSEEQNKRTLENADKSKKEIENLNGKALAKNSTCLKDKDKSDSKDDRLRNNAKSSKSDDRDRRERNCRSAIERDRGFRNQGRDDRSYGDRDRGRKRREDRRNRDRSDRRSIDYRRRRSRTPEKRDRNKSRERSRERSRSKRNQEQGNDFKDAKGKKELKETKKQTVIETKKENDVEEHTKITIWEKRTVGPVFEAAVEQYKQRKAARGS